MNIKKFNIYNDTDIGTDNGNSIQIDINNDNNIDGKNLDVKTDITWSYFDHCLTFTINASSNNAYIYSSRKHVSKFKCGRTAMSISERIPAWTASLSFLFQSASVCIIFETFGAVSWTGSCENITKQISENNISRISATSPDKNY